MNILDICMIATVAIIVYILFSIHSKNSTDNDDPMLNKLIEDMITLDPRMKDKVFHVGNESYTEDKKRIYLCIKDSEGHYYPYNVLIQVAIHEMAHALSNHNDPIHVTSEFNDLHLELRKKAMTMGMFKQEDNVPTGYCTHKN